MEPNEKSLETALRIFPERKVEEVDIIQSSLDKVETEYINTDTPQISTVYQIKGRSRLRWREA